MKPLNKFILIDPISQETAFFETAAAMDNRAYHQGIVFSKSDEVLSIADGDRVLFNKHNGYEQRLNDKIYIIIEERGLVAILEEGELA